ncbi:MAG: hypothetical protein JJU15_20335 [Pararhodobacter sp.]|nr:hypothetical protein [Pararhodobacter sp.]
MDWKNFSYTTQWARFCHWFEGVFTSFGGKLPAVRTPLPESEQDALRARLEPLSVELEMQRLATVDAVDATARLWVTGVMVAALVLVFGAGGGVVAALAVAAFAGLGTFAIVQNAPAERYRLAVKQAFGGAVSDHLSGFSYTARPEPDANRIQSWRLFPRIDRITVEDRMTGQRMGREVALSRLTVVYGRTGGKNKRNLSVGALCTEVETGPGVEGVNVIIPHTIGPRLRDAPGKVHGLTSVATGDEGFDTRYCLWSSAPDAVASWMNVDMRARILALEGEAPILIFLPRYLAVLFPLTGLAQPFTPRPFWDPLETDQTLALFASDLADKHARLMTTLEIWPAQEAEDGPGPEGGPDGGAGPRSDA